MCNNKQHVLALDVGGQPYDWLHWREAVTLYARDEIAWEAGEDSIVVHGGINQRTGLQSEMVLNSIVSVRGSHVKHKTLIPALTNRALFSRDSHMCMYCGTTLPTSLLTRDHVQPTSRGGRDCWENVITACRACNGRKDNRNPHEAHMPLLAIPYAPNRAEYLILQNRRIHILADQMGFLRRHVPKARQGLLV